MNFKKGLYRLNKNENYNFQLNRLVNWDGGDLEEVKKISAKIHSNEDWKEELIALGDTALKNRRVENAIGYYRMSEFFMSEEDEDKKKYYKKAVKLFYEHYKDYFLRGIVERKNVPFQDITLPVLYAKNREHNERTIVFHGGNDSYFEELFFPMLYFWEKGYNVYLFEGPGQGGVLREQGKKFTYKWEEPVKTILDYFDLKRVVLIGVSLGGMLSLRAAAFEKRIEKVVAWSIFPDFFQIALHDLSGLEQLCFKILMKCRQKALIDSILYREMKKDIFTQWVVEHGMYAYGAESPYEYIRKLQDFQMLNIAKNIGQDVLILHGKEDHFIDWKFYKEEVDSLVNARSITLRLFTTEEFASNHCQCGNTKLVLDTIVKWLY